MLRMHTCIRTENLVSLVGIVTVGDPTMLLVSFCEHGSLLDVLRNQHPPNCNSRRNSQIVVTNSNNYHGISNGNGNDNMAAGGTVASSGSHAPPTAKERRTLLLELLKTATSSAATAKATDTEFVAVQNSSLNGGVPKVMQRSNIFSNSEKRRALIEQLLRQTAVEENAMQQLQLQQHQSLNSSTFSSSYTGAYTGPPLFSCADRHRMLLETAKGMAHLTKFFVHRDLAARNVLVDSALTCRIGDFGLSRGLTRRMTLAPTSNSSSRKASSDADSGMIDHNDGNSAAGAIGDAHRYYGGNQGEQRRASRWSQINTDDTGAPRFTPLKSASESCSSIDQAPSWPPNVELSDDLVYYQSVGGVYPIRSTPPEAMMFHRFTPASDVWSWSMLAVEIFTGGMRPFAGVANAALPQRLSAGLRPSQPDSCPQATFELLQQCWQAEPSRRPTFDALVKACEDLTRRRAHESADLHPTHSGSNSDSTSGQPLLSTLPKKTNSSVSVKTPAGEYEYAIRPKSGASLLSSTSMSSTAGSGRNSEGRATFATRRAASTAEYGIGSTVRGVCAADDAANNDWNRVIGLVGNAAAAAAPSSAAIESDSVVSYFPIATAQSDIKRGQSGGMSELLTGPSSEKSSGKSAPTPAPTAARSKQMVRSNEHPKKYRSSSASSAVAIATSARRPKKLRAVSTSSEPDIAPPVAADEDCAVQRLSTASDQVVHRLNTTSNKKYRNAIKPLGMGDRIADKTLREPDGRDRQASIDANYLQLVDTDSDSESPVFSKTSATAGTSTNEEDDYVPEFMPVPASPVRKRVQLSRGRGGTFVDGGYGSRPGMVAAATAGVTVERMSSGSVPRTPTDFEEFSFPHSRFTLERPTSVVSIGSIASMSSETDGERAARNKISRLSSLSDSQFPAMQQGFLEQAQQADASSTRGVLTRGGQARGQSSPSRGSLRGSNSPKAGRKLSSV